MLTNKLMGASGPEKQFVEDLFAVHLYTGNGSTQTINNGIDLAGKGGMVWVKSRSSSTLNHAVVDTVRGAYNTLYTNTTGAASEAYATVGSFSSTGFNVTNSSDTGNTNASGSNYASWTFRKAPKFFDVVTYTGDGVAGRTISHSLGQTPGMLIVKRTDTTANWQVYHRSIGANFYIQLNLTNAATDDTGSTTKRWQLTEPTSSVFTLGDSSTVNASGGTYVAYLFAHDTSTDGLIQCGSFTTDGSGNATVNLGWEPQYLMVKKTSGTGNWQIVDNMRGFSQTQVGTLLANTVAVEGSASGNYTFPDATGFSVKNSAVGTGSFVYMAIRRGPMRTPTDGTKVFSSYTASSIPTATAITTNFPVDLSIIRQRIAANDYFWFDRLRNDYYLSSNTTAAEVASNYLNFDSNTSINTAIALSSTPVLWNFKRALGFFDVVCYTGTGATRTVNHNLGVVPELMFVKSRSATSNWRVYHKDSGATKSLALNMTNAEYPALEYWNNTEPTSTQFTVGSISNTSGATYVSYLFASCPGVSKVGSYTGNGSSQTINCGFTSGARFVLIKIKDNIGDWYVWDTARGIVTGTDPHLSLNTAVAEVTTDDTIDPDSTGFVVNQVTATNMNVSDASYIYMAIA